MESDFAKQALPKWQKEHPSARLMRNNAGMAWQGNNLRTDSETGKRLILENPRPVYFGIGLPVKNKKTGRITQKGGGDYIGWESFILCQIFDDKKNNNRNKNYICNEYYNLKERCKNCPLNKKIAVFLSLETKSKDYKESPDQIRFRKAVQAAGGIAIVLKEGEE